jgi:hypothetical protein
MKKKNLLFCCIIFIFMHNAHAKSFRIKGNEKKSQEGTILLNITSGINNPDGLVGVSIGTHLNPKLAINLGLGLSSFGWKINIRGLYFLKNTEGKGLAVGGALQYNTGLKYTMAGATLPLSNDRTGKGSTSGVISFNTLIGYHFKLSNDVRFYIQSGLGFRITQPSINFKYTGTNIPINYQDERLLNFYAPTLLHLGSGISIRLKSK